MNSILQAWWGATLGQHSQETTWGPLCPSTEIPPQEYWRTKGECLRQGGVSLIVPSTRRQVPWARKRSRWVRPEGRGGDRTAELQREPHGSGGSMAPGGWMPAPGSVSLTVPSTRRQVPLGRKRSRGAWPEGWGGPHRGAAKRAAWERWQHGARRVDACAMERLDCKAQVR